MNPIMETENKQSFDDEIRPRLASRLRAFLLCQENLLKKYIKILDLLRTDLLEENLDHLQEHTLMEQSVLREISSIQRAAAALSAQFPDWNSAQPELVPHRDSVCSLAALAGGRNRENQTLILRRLPELKEQISRVRKPHLPGFSGSESADSRYLNISV